MCFGFFKLGCGIVLQISIEFKELCLKGNAYAPTFLPTRPTSRGENLAVAIGFVSENSGDRSWGLWFMGATPCQLDRGVLTSQRDFCSYGQDAIVVEIVEN